jgi:glycosyltransferase involved in cell wall biosynthesis
VPERLPGTPAILFVGGNYLRKGLPALLRAAALLRPGHPDLRIHVVGGDRRRPRFERLARRLGVAGAVAFHGWRDNDRVRSLMAGADLFAMPSRVEAFGLVYLEAMRAGTPVIATCRGGAAEAFADGREALLVDPDDPAAIAAAIRRIGEEPDLRRTLVEGGRAAAARFTVEAAVAATEAVYREAVAPDSASR